MDPATLALIGAAILAGIGIKRASTPSPRPFPEKESIAEKAVFSGIPPHAFAGGLRRPVTHRAVTGERVVEGAEEEGERRRIGVEPASPGGLPSGLGGRAIAAMASGGLPDVVGGVSGGAVPRRAGGGGTTTTSTLSGTRPTTGTSIYSQPPIYGGALGGTKLSTIRR